jgi:hypothetical protein
VAVPGGQRYHPPRDPSLPVERAGVFFPSGSGAADGGPEDRDAGGGTAANGLPGA